MINWEILYDENGKNNKRTGMAFEELAKLYLQKTYPQYNWKQTQGSWDGNKDFTSMVCDYIWAEAKYKKNLSPLKRQDIDSTFVSGLINGKLRVIVFITNTTIPHTITDRVNQFSFHYDVTVIFISKIQLEYWLYNHEDIYEKFFKRQLPASDKETLPAVSIEFVSFSNQKNEDLRMPFQTMDLEYGNFYQLNIMFQSMIEQIVEITLPSDSPIQFSKSLSYCNPKECKITPGIHNIKFLIRVTGNFNGNITINVTLSDGVTLAHVFPCRCYYKFVPKLIYAKQHDTFINLYQFLKSHNVSERSRIIWLTGPDGSGKSYVLDMLLQEFFADRDITKITFLDDVHINNVRLCRIIMYLNFGAIGNYLNEEMDDNDIENLCYQLLHSQNQVLFSKEWIDQLVNGCLNAIDAGDFIHAVDSKKYIIQHLIHPQNCTVSRILLCDDLQYLNLNQRQVFKAIIDQSEKYTNAVIVLSGIHTDTSIYHTQAVWELNQLSFNDIKDSIRENLDIKNSRLTDNVIRQFPLKPILVSDILTILKQESSGNNLLHIIHRYNTICRDNKLYSVKFSSVHDMQELMDMIYIFAEGISHSALRDAGFEAVLIDNIKCSEFCAQKSGKITARHTIYRKAYLDFRGKALFSNELVQRLIRVLMLPDRNYPFESDQAFTILMKCDRNIYDNYGKEIQKRFHQLYFSGEYKNAVFYAEAYYEFVMAEEESLNGEDWIQLFYSGVCMMHCDLQYKGAKVFQYIFDKAPKNLIARYMAGAEILNSRFWRFNTQGYELFAIELEKDLCFLSQTVSKKEPEHLLDTYIALSTCQNRLMVMYLLKDQYQSAREKIKGFYEFYPQLLVKDEAERYSSMWGEWLLDFARGLAYEEPALAIQCMEESKKLLNPDINLRRVLLCELDLIVLKCLYQHDMAGVILQIETLIEKLKVERFYSEYFKATIKLCFCKVFIYQEELKREGSDKETYIEELENNIYETIITTNARLSGREVFLVYSLMGLLAYLKGDYNTVQSSLEQAGNSVQECGNSYEHIVRHNRSLPKEPEGNQVTVCFKNTVDSDSWWIDPRIW